MTLRITVTLFGFGLIFLGVVHAAFSTTTAVMESTDAGNGCPNSSWTAENRSCYLYVREGIGFYQANESCKTLESNLVSISSDEENQIIRKLVGMLPVWIGLYRTTNESCEGAGCLNWMWLDGSEAGYRKWATVFPTPGQCVLMTAEGDWGHSDPCSRKNGYVCGKKRIIPTTTSEPTTIMSAREMTTFFVPAGNVASSTDSSKTYNDGSSMTLIIGCVIGGLVVSGIIIVAVVVLVKRHRNSSHTDQLTGSMDRKLQRRDSSRGTVERNSSKRDKPRKEQGKKSRHKNKPKKVKDNSSTKDQQKIHNTDDTLPKVATGINKGYCHEGVELGSTTSAHGVGFNPEPVYAEPIKKEHRPRSEGVKVQENSLYASA